MDFIFDTDSSHEEIHRVKPEAKKPWPFEPSFPCLLLMTKGSFSLSVDGKKGPEMEWGEILFLSPGSSYVFVPEANTEFFLLQIPACATYLSALLSTSLYKERGDLKKTPQPLVFTPILWEYTRNLHILIEKMSPSLAKIKTLELFSLLSVSYSAKELRSLFRPILREKEDFSSFVWRNYKKVKTAEELARLSGHCQAGFENKFKETFHTSPYKWMMERKKEFLCHELIHSDCPIQELSDKCGFASPSQMNDFCKKHIGLTPGVIRSRSKC